MRYHGGAVFVPSTLGYLTAGVTGRKEYEGSIAMVVSGFQVDSQVKSGSQSLFRTSDGMASIVAPVVFLLCGFLWSLFRPFSGRARQVPRFKSVKGPKLKSVKAPSAPSSSTTTNAAVFSCRRHQLFPRKGFRKFKRLQMLPQ